MAISSVSMGMNATQWGAYQQKLTQATKNELEQLGISYTDDMTEAQARALIEQTKAQSRNSAANEENQEGENAQNMLFEQAKKLAEKIGISVSDDATLDDLLSQIETALEEKIEANSDNIQALSELKSYSRQLAYIQAQSTGSTGMDATNQALMMSLEMLSEYNKSFLNS